MIDVENEIYTPIALAVREKFPGVTVSGEYVLAPSSLPHVSIVEQDNYLSIDRLTGADTEEYATLMYEVNVYSDKVNGKKAQCRAIMSTISDLFYAKNFQRISLSPIPNLDNARIYRLTARFRAETDGKYMYRR